MFLLITSEETTETKLKMKVVITPAKCDYLRSNYSFDSKI